MGLLKGVARVNGKAVIDGTMTFALGPPQEPPESSDVAARAASAATQLHRRQRDASALPAVCSGLTAELAARRLSSAEFAPKPAP